MASTKLYLDKRNQKKDGTYPIKIAVSHIKTFYIPTGVSVAEKNWIGGKIEGSGVKNKNTLNAIISGKYHKVGEFILRLSLEGELPSMTTRQLQNAIKRLFGEEPEETPVQSEMLFKTRVENYITTCVSSSSKNQYKSTLNKVAQFADIDTLLITDITVAWLKDFDAHCLNSGMSVNGKAVYLRAICTIINDAIDRELIGYDKYPFRRFKIKRAPTMHRNIPITKLREMYHFDPARFLLQQKEKANKHTSLFPDIKRYIDLFFLSFFLCGINIKDLLFLPKNSIIDGTISLVRSKTKVPFMLKIEPEAQAIIDKYKGRKYLLNFLDSYSTDDYKTFEKRMNTNIQFAFPGITSYWARHSWATIAAELDVPDPIIDIAQGRSPKGITSIYVNRDIRKAFQANRKVIDYLCGYTHEELQSRTHHPFVPRRPNEAWYR